MSSWSIETNAPVCNKLLISSRSAINPEHLAAIGENKTLGVNTCPIKFRVAGALIDYDERNENEDDDNDVNGG